MEPLCTGCRSPRVESQCGVCEGAICRKCRIFLSAEEFPHVSGLPPELQHTYYCGACYDDKVAPFKADYEQTLESAKGVDVIYKNSKSVVRVLRRAPETVSVEGARDRDEAILRLAFQAVRAGFHAIVDVEVTSQKIRNEGWQKSAWSGRGVPADISSHEAGF